MLDVLIKEGITDVAVVVTRYFGGVLLGTGGLVRAYQKATQEGLAASQIITKLPGQYLHIATDYNGLGKLQYLFGQNGIVIKDTEYGADVKLTIICPINEKESIEKSIIEQTNGTAKLEWGDLLVYATVGKDILTF